MRKTRMLLAGTIGAVIIAVAVVWMLVSLVGEKPLHSLQADQVRSMEVTVLPPNRTKIIEDPDKIKLVVKALQNVKVYGKSGKWREQNGQFVQFSLELESGETIRIGAFNPFLVLDGQGFKTKYGPCEELNRLANQLVK